MKNWFQSLLFKCTLYRYPADFNQAIPPNLYLVPSAGAISWSHTQDNADGGGGEHDQPMWTRKGDGWWPVACKLRAAVEALPR
jgi:hypothetical protein